MAVSAQPNEKQIYADSLYKAAVKEKDPKKMAEAYFLYGKIEFGNVNYNKASKWFHKSLQILDKYEDSYEKGRIYLRLSTIEFEQNHPEEGLNYLSIASEIFKKANSLRGLMMVNSTIGLYYSKPRRPKNKIQYDSSLYYLRKAEYYSVISKDTLGQAELWHSIGKVLKDMNDKESIKYLTKAVIVYNNYKKGPPYIHLLINLAETYSRFRKFREAKKILNKVEDEINNNYSDNDYLHEHLQEAYYFFYEQRNDWQKAFEHFSKKKELQEKKLLADREGAISRFNIEYETQKKQALLARQKIELALKDQNLSQQNRFLLVVGVLLIFALSLCFFLFKLYQKNKQISEKNAILVQEQNHRVKNNLQIVSSLLRLQSTEIEDKKAKQAVNESQLRIESMAILHRQLYENEQLDAIDMDFFINQLAGAIFGSYGLEEVKTDFRIGLRDLQVDKAIYLGLMMNELISNACKYAFLNHPEPILEILLVEKEGEIILKLRDNGNTQFIRSENSSSFGFKLIDMMVEQLDGIAGMSYNNGFEFLMKCK